jgi:hypothetical protein
VVVTQGRRRQEGLLPSQRLEVFEVATSQGFTRTQFEWHTTTSGYNNRTEIDRLVIRDTGYFFDFDKQAVATRLLFRPRYSPGLQHRIGTGMAGDWSVALGGVGPWLNNVRREMAITDPWTSAFSAGDALDDVPWDEEDNSPFSEAEVAAIEARIVVVKHFFASREVPPAEAEAIERKLDYLVEASRRTGRLDWKNIATTTILSTGLAGALGAEQTRQIFEFVVGLAQRLLQSG